MGTSDDDDNDEEEEEIIQNETECKAGHYVFMDTGILFPLLNELVKCPRCGFSVETNNMLQEKQGHAQLLKISCCSISCRWEKSFYTSERVKNSGRGAKPFDINLRTIMAFREIGRGHAAMNTFCGYMNMPPPMAEITFNETVKSRLHPAYIDIVNRNMEDSAKEVRVKLADESESEVSVYDTAVSCDGSWQHRGYASINGLVTAINIDTGKCLAFETLVKNCKACEMWASRKGTTEYNTFVQDHNCPINHHGSAGAMEAVGIVNIFQRSVADLQLCFTTFVGDGDSKAYPAVLNADPYGPDKLVEKGECGRLRKLKKEKGGEVLSDGKKLGGIGRLNEKYINRLQNYYGLAIRQNMHSLINMRKAVGAVLYHCSEAATTEARHMFCDKDSQWCKYRMAEKKGEAYVEKPGLPIAVRNAIFHIFHDLSSEELLKKCLHGKTQNNNEAINNIIWTRLPKNIYIGWYTFQIGVASAVVSFNSGAHGLLDVFRQLNMVVGCFTKKFCLKSDMTRIKKMERKMSV